MLKMFEGISTVIRNEYLTTAKQDKIVQVFNAKVFTQYLKTTSEQSGALFDLVDLESYKLAMY